jgi:AcrR family transcriptional regulator
VTRKVIEWWFNKSVARPRKHTDEAIIAAAGRVIGRAGPGFTLAEVAAEAGVAAGTIVHRFGSKHGLLVAMTRGAVEQIRAVGGDVVDLVVDAYADLDDPATAANNLAQLAVDLTDPVLRELMAEFYAALEQRLETALAGQDLPGAPEPAVAARILAAIADGTAIHWSARPVGSLRARLREDVSAVVDGWRRPLSKGTRT